MLLPPRFLPEQSSFSGSDKFEPWFQSRLKPSVFWSALVPFDCYCHCDCAVKIELQTVGGLNPNGTYYL